jgi:hypothetical protein
MKVTINQVIEDFNTLVPEEKEFVIDIFQKIIIESRRETFSKGAKKAVANFKAGKVKKGTAHDLYKDLEND